jgi:hypothetical protein
VQDRVARNAGIVDEDVDWGDSPDIWHASGDANNAVPAAVGYNFARLLAWLREILCALLRIWLLLHSQRACQPALSPPPT